MRLVDCPGLVMPNFVPMETQVRNHRNMSRKHERSHHVVFPLQVLSGILPISKVSAAPACVYHASQLLPLERVFGLSHPALSTSPAEDKRTWREPRAQDQSKELEPAWTAMDVLTAYAGAKSWMTARAGRLDVNRAGNASGCTLLVTVCLAAADSWCFETVLRALAEGRVRWGFWPPGTDTSVLSEAGDGIWISSGDDAAGVDSESDGEEEGGEQYRDSEPDEGGSQEGDFPDEEEEGEEDEESSKASFGGRFGALALEDTVPESTEEE